MKIFVLGVPHTQTSLSFTTCAFTQKARNLCAMMHRRGHEVVHLGVEGSEVECEHVTIVPRSLWQEHYGHPGAHNYDLAAGGRHAAYHEHYANAARAAILERCARSHEAIICCTWGGAQQTAVQGLPQFIVESGIGYRHTWAPYRVFESYAWMHALYGEQGWFLSGKSDRWYDAVIPNAFDPDLFDPSRPRAGYLLFVGRLNADKGIRIAVDLAARVGRQLIVAGQGDFAPFAAPHVEYVGPVGAEQRKDLMARAAALVCPTLYVEPFGGVAVEAQLSGCPVICTDWGAFPETVLHGVTGYRCRTMGQFEWAARHLDRIDSRTCRDWAERNYSLDAVGRMYEEYFTGLLELNRAGWYEPRERDLGWLRKSYP